MSKYKIVVFDLDGTLVDSIVDLSNAVNKGLEKVNLPTHSVDAYKTFVGNGRENLIKRAMGTMCNNKALFDIVINQFDQEYKVHSNDNTYGYDGCKELLYQLNRLGIKTAVLSNKPDEFISDILNKVYPNHRFDVAWGKKPDLPTKPDGTSLLKMLDLFGFNCEQCLYIGDSDVDVKTAKNAGVDMLGVSWGFRGTKELIEAGAMAVVDKASEILEYVK